MVAKGCPLPKEGQPGKCKHCLVPREDRYRMCNWYKGIIDAGVPMRH